MIYGQKVRLRAIEREDIPHFVRWFNDPEVTRHLAAYMPMSRAAEEKWFERQLEDKNSVILGIEATDGDKPVLIGNIGLHRINWKDRQAVLGIVIGEKDYWNKGYGTDAIRALLDHAFRQMNLNRIWLIVDADNPRAIRCYEKCGFRQEGRMRQSVFRDGAYYDQLLMSVLQEEWKGG